MKSNVTKFFIAILILATYFSYNSLDAATMHALVIADTHNLPKKKDDDPERFIGKAVAKDLKHMSRFLEDAAYAADLKFKLTVIRDNEVHGKNIYQALNKINPDKDDVFVFYFSGHGFRFSKTSSILPYIWFSQDNEGIALNEIASMIKQKGARLSLIVADCCNNVDNSPCKILAKEDFAFGKNKKVTQNYKKLFMDYSGMLIATGSEQGGYGNTYDDTGSDFTNMLIKVIKSTVKNKHPNQVCWGDILETTKIKVAALFEEDEDDEDDEPQIPYYEIEELFEV